MLQLGNYGREVMAARTHRCPARLALSGPVVGHYSTGGSAVNARVLPKAIGAWRRGCADTENPHSRLPWCAINLILCGRSPDANRAVPRCRNEKGRVLRETQSRDASRVAPQRRTILACHCIPQTNCAVQTTRDNQITRRRQNYRVNRNAMSLKGPCLTTNEVVDLDQPVHAAGNEPASVPRSR